jgi:hypothetical protein
MFATIPFKRLVLGAVLARRKPDGRPPDFGDDDTEL